jgi:leader peptidase (prepilin peptidase)/N-methyltransferase
VTGGWAWAAYLFLAAVLAALSVIDLKSRRLPDAIVLPAYPVLAALLALASWHGAGWGALGRGAVAAAVMAAAYLVLWLAVPGGLGLGDVKLAGLLGLGLGWLGWGQLAVGALAAFALGALAGAVAVAVRRLRRRGGGGRTTIAFGPWMCLGGLVGAVWGGVAWEWYLGLLGA